MKRIKNNGRGKMTPIRLRKVERSTLSNSKSKKVSVAGAGERGKMVECGRFTTGVGNC